ncbi:hypothetical protein [Paraburkholderia hospita]|uniref:hypothetical protein n=1 Tax=Paraburkholderia hospita TaxID=169430 RepID=UPI000271BFD3|nr:hypothetical protein [Paraburkholderia hospita]EUC21482.1 hypothetical protein PMI06_009198 [Burkholderia sp. BT03]SKC95303.1 hypothetical protein SAMN06266956_6886 [Paraburkholderia hospita]
MRDPANWPCGRLRDQIASAQSGNEDDGRALLRTAAFQLRQHGQLEPDLADYLASVLKEVADRPAKEAARILSVAPPRRSANRPRNTEREARMVAWWKAACEAPILDPGDEAHIRIQAARISEIESEPERYAQFVDLQEEIQESMRYTGRSTTSNDTYRLAAVLFNHMLAEAQQDGRRMDERPVTPSAIKAAVNRARERVAEVRK